MHITTKMLARKNLLLIALVALTVLSLPAMASLVELKWDEQSRFAHRTELKAGGSLELCGKLDAGLNIDWRYQSTQALDFNIHFHEGKEVVVPVKHKEKAELQALFEVKQTQGYCWMWTNRTKEKASLEIALERLK